MFWCWFYLRLYYFCVVLIFVWYLYCLLWYVVVVCYYWGCFCCWGCFRCWGWVGLGWCCVLWWLLLLLLIEIVGLVLCFDVVVVLVFLFVAVAIAIYVVQLFCCCCWDVWSVCFTVCFLIFQFDFILHVIDIFTNHHLVATFEVFAITDHPFKVKLLFKMLLFQIFVLEYLQFYTFWLTFPCTLVLSHYLFGMRFIIIFPHVLILMFMMFLLLGILFV